nr:hypothetical protein CFP56_53330 [Quercus suber]
MDSSRMSGGSRSRSDGEEDDEIRFVSPFLPNNKEEGNGQTQAGAIGAPSRHRPPQHSRRRGTTSRRTTRRE